MFKCKIGWQRIAFPTNPKFRGYINLDLWRKELPPFFFYGKEIKGLEKQPSNMLKEQVVAIKKGTYTYFNKKKIDIGIDYDWLTNPITRYTYDIDKHWSKIIDLSENQGDIKYVWEKARFSFLYDLIRYDYHFEENQSDFVFKQISDFMHKNPINQGPNYKCSQEIGLRILNWTFALYYYRDSEHLTKDLFDRMIHYIYWQLHHIYHNINFSRISVRNNHAITEVLVLYLGGKLFPFLPNVKKWSKKGRKCFEEEIAYQIYEDGTFLQFSMNYHRVVVQLLTWAIRLSELNNDSFGSVIYDGAKKSLIFLETCMDDASGKLPNYGANDGALFFKLTDDDYRIYRSQLDDLRAVLFGRTFYNSKSPYWYGIQPDNAMPPKTSTISSFEKGGYYLIQEGDTKTFLRCGAYKDRPSQSDNLHLDIWFNGVNYLRDSGSFQYNTTKDLLHYFLGCESHNTVGIDGENQMQKAGRFVWHYWVKEAKAFIVEKNDGFEFEGTIKAFKHLGNNITHQRVVHKKKGLNEWYVQDRINCDKDKLLYQYWQLNPACEDKIEITTEDETGNKLIPLREEKYFSEYYSVKEPSIRLTFKTRGKLFKTKIKIYQ